jgi:hypothetical protein
MLTLQVGHFIHIGRKLDAAAPILILEEGEPCPITHVYRGRKSRRIMLSCGPINNADLVEYWQLIWPEADFSGGSPYGK